MSSKTINAINKTLLLASLYVYENNEVEAIIEMLCTSYISTNKHTLNTFTYIHTHLTYLHTHTHLTHSHTHTHTYTHTQTNAENSKNANNIKASSQRRIQLRISFSGVFFGEIPYTVHGAH